MGREFCLFCRHSPDSQASTTPPERSARTGDITGGAGYALPAGSRAGAGQGDRGMMAEDTDSEGSATRSSHEGANEPPAAPLFDAASTRKMILALGRAAASSIAAGIAISTGQPQDIRAVLRIQKEVFNAFSSLAYRDPSLPPISELAEGEPAIKILSAINRFSAAAISHGVIASSGQPHSVGDAMRTFYGVMATMWPSEPAAARDQAAPSAAAAGVAGGVAGGSSGRE